MMLAKDKKPNCTFSEWRTETGIHERDVSTIGYIGEDLFAVYGILAREGYGGSSSSVGEACPVGNFDCPISLKSIIVHFNLGHPDGETADPLVGAVYGAATVFWLYTDVYATFLTRALTRKPRVCLHSFINRYRGRVRALSRSVDVL